jgi:hypothetical protein
MAAGAIVEASTESSSIAWSTRDGFHALRRPRGAFSFERFPVDRTAA